MTQLPSYPQLQGLAQRLGQGRARLQQQRFIYGIGWGVLLSASVWLGLGLLRWIGVVWADTAIRFLPLVILAVWVFAVALYILRTLPSLLLIAQKAERQFGLEERLSTALEVAQKTPRDAAHTRIYQALLDDAAAKTVLVNPRQIFHFKTPKALLYGLGIGALALGLHFVPPLSLRAISVQAPTLSQSEQKSTLTQLERITQLVQRDAERTNDPYLQATVRSLEQLKAQIRSGQLAAPMAQQEIARLSEQIEKGYNLPSSTQPNTANSSAANIQNPVGSNPQNIPNTNQPNQPEPNNQSVQNGQPSSNPNQRLENLARRLQAKAEQSQNQSQSRAPTPKSQSQQADCNGAACSDIYAKARAEQAKAAEAPKNQVNRPQGGAAGGFGDQAGKDAGGKSGARGTTRPPQTKAEQVKLPFQAPPSGRRIQILGPAATSNTNNVGGTVEAQNWVRQTEVPIGLGYLTAPNRSVVSNYFTPQKETP